MNPPADKWHHYTSGKTCTVVQAARILGCSRWTVYRMIADGKLAAWSPHKGRARLYERQVMDHAAACQAQAIKKARVLQSQLVLDLI